MPETEQWQASLPEQRTARGLAACCIILVFLASVRPEWFELPVPAPQQQTIKKVQAKKAPHAPPVIQHHPVKTQLKTHKIQPKPKKPPAMVTPPRSVSDTATIGNGFYVQLGAFHERPRAQGLTDQLKRKGWNAVISVRKNGLYAVWVGPKKTRTSAEKLLKTIQRKLKIKGFIVHQKNA